MTKIIKLKYKMIPNLCILQFEKIFDKIKYKIIYEK